MANFKRIEEIFMGKLNEVKPLPLLRDAILNNSDKILDIPKVLQLDKGLDSEGNPLKEYAKYYISRDDTKIIKHGGKPGEEYAVFKNRKNSRPGLGRPDLKLSGETYKSMRLRVTNEGTQVEVNDQYNLKDQYGEQVFDIDKDHVDIMAAYVKDEFIQRFRDKML